MIRRTRTYFPKLLPRVAIQMTSTSLPESEGLMENGIAPLTSHNECLRAEVFERFEAHSWIILRRYTIYYIQLINTRMEDLSYLFLYST